MQVIRFRKLFNLLFLIVIVFIIFAVIIVTLPNYNENYAEVKVVDFATKHFVRSFHITIKDVLEYPPGKYIAIFFQQ